MFPIVWEAMSDSSAEGDKNDTLGARRTMYVSLVRDRLFDVPRASDWIEFAYTHTPARVILFRSLSEITEM